MRKSQSGRQCLAVVLLMTLAGCATLPRHVVKPRSEALQNPETTSLGRILAAEEGAKNLSGIRLLTSGEEALNWRRRARHGIEQMFELPEVRDTLRHIDGLREQGTA